MKKSFICVLLAVVMIFSAAQGMICGIAESIPEKETPVAKIENDNYVPYNYENRNNDGDIINSLNSEIESMGGYVEKYSSEEEYQRAQKSASSSAADYSLAESQIESVKQTFTVMTTPTGSKEHGNYVESKPVANAIVRLDGVPRYTDRNGQIKVTLNREYVELYVEKEGYNPYIEIIEPTGEEKVINLKKPSDDIDIYAVMMEYEGEYFNLLTQSCYLNKDLDMSYCEISILCNVSIESAYLFVNGKVALYSPTGKIENFDFSEYNVSDRFSVKIISNGVKSKEHSLNLTIIDPTMPEISFSDGNASNRSSNNSVIIGDDNSPLGELGVVFLPIDQLFIYLDKIFNSYEKAFELFDPTGEIKDSFKIKISYCYDPREGTIERAVGFDLTLNIKSKDIDHEKRSLEKYEKKMAEYNAEQKKYEDQIVGLQNEIEELENNRNGHIDYFEEKREEKKEQIASLQEELKNLTDDNERQSTNDQIKKLKKSIYNVVYYHSKQAKNLLDQIIDKKIDKFKLENLKEAAKKPAHKMNKIFKDKKSSFDLDLEFEFLGVIKYSAVTHEVVKSEISGSIVLKFNYCFSFTVWVIPMFVNVEVKAGFNAKIILVKEETGETFSLDEFLNFFELYFIFGLRLDIGVGVKGLAYVSGFVSGEVKFAIVYRGEDLNGHHTFNWSAGIKAKALFWEKEWAHHGEEITFSARSGGKLMKRSFASDIAYENKAADNLYQCSDLNFVELDGGKQLMVWLEDSPERDDFNRTVLKYSILNNGEWSAPESVYDDGKADLFYDLHSDENGVYLTWQKCNRNFNEADNEATVMSAGEIYFAEFNKNIDKFENIIQITDNELMDGVPLFALREKSTDPLTIVWQRNSENDIYQLTGTNSILCSSFINGGWTKPQELFSSNLSFNGIDAAIKNDKLTVAIVTGTQGDNLSMENSVTIVTDTESFVIESSGVQNVQFIKTNSGVNLIYYAAGQLYISEELTSSRLLTDIPKDAVPFDCSVTNSDYGIIITYQKLKGEYKQAYCAICGENGSWIYNIPLTQEQARVYDSYGILTSENSILFVYGVEDEDGNAVLCYGQKSLKASLDIEDITYWGQLIDGEDKELFINVCNTGDFDFYVLNIAVFGESVELDLADLPLRVGETREFIVPVTVHIIEDKEKVIIQGIHSKAVAAYDEYLLNLALTEIEVDIEINIVNGKQIFTAKILNNSNYTTKVELKIYKNAVKVYIYNLELVAGDVKTIDFEFDEIAENDYVFCCAETDIEDAMNVNNSKGVFSVKDEFIINPNLNCFESSLNFARSIT